MSRELENMKEFEELLRGKLSKRSVHYGQGVEHRKCSQCAMWQPPEGCSLVAGKISPAGVCDRFERKRSKE